MTGQAFVDVDFQGLRHPGVVPANARLKVHNDEFSNEAFVKVYAVNAYFAVLRRCHLLLRCKLKNTAVWLRGVHALGLRLKYNQQLNFGSWERATEKISINKCMRLHEITTEPRPPKVPTTPQTPDQMRVATLKATKDRAATALQSERERQRRTKALKVLTPARPLKPIAPG